jgi:hypothetical protein
MLNKIIKLEKEIEQLRFKISELKDEQNSLMEKASFEYLGLKKGDIIILNSGPLKGKDFKVKTIEGMLTSGSLSFSILQVAGNIRYKTGEWSEPFRWGKQLIYDCTINSKNDFKLVE